MVTITTPNGFKVKIRTSRRYIVIAENTAMRGATIVYRSDDLKDALENGARIGRYTYDTSTGQEVI